MHLLDTQVLLWWLSNDKRLSQTDRQTLAHDPCAVSAASVWEIEVKRATGKLVAPAQMLVEIEAQRFRLESITPEDAYAAGRLPFHHLDPFDRMLAAQAKIRGWRLLTYDAKLRLYL